eukprot:4230764-Amphidinium_carterae.1
MPAHPRTARGKQTGHRKQDMHSHTERAHRVPDRAPDESQKPKLVGANETQRAVKSPKQTTAPWRQ